MKAKFDIANMIKLGFVLAVFATAACVMLAFVYNGTKGRIEHRQQVDLELALKELFPDVDDFVPAEVVDPTPITPGRPAG